MPITGTFLADFSQFDSAVQGAGAKLRAFEGDAGKTGNALKDMETSSQTLSTRMIALGSAVGSFIGNFAFNALQSGVRSIVAMGQEAFTSAGHILDLSNKTGLTTTTIQRMQFVAEQTGGSLDQFTQAAFQLGARLSGGGASVQKAVQELGVSFRELQTMRPDQQFDTIVGALGRMDDATKRNELGVAIFGRSFSTIAAAVGEGYEGIADKAKVSTDAQLQALDKLADRWKAFTTTTTTNVQAWLGKMVIAFQETDLAGAGFIEMHRRLKETFIQAGVVAEDYDSQLRAIGVHLGTEVIPKQESYTVQLAKAKAEVAALDTETRKEIEAAKALGISTEDLTVKFGLSEEALKLVTGEMSKLASESDKTKAAIDRMKGSAQTFLDVIMPGTSKAAGLARSRAEQAGLTPDFTPEGLKPLDFGPGGKHVSGPTGALAQHLAEQTAIREQAEALALLETQMKENFIIVGAVGDAHVEAAEKAKVATDETVRGYAAVQQQVAMSGDAIREWINLQKYSAAANAILAENKLFTSRSQLERISKIPTGGGGGITVINNNQGAFLNTPADQQRLAERTGAAVRDQLMANGRQVA